MLPYASDQRTIEPLQIEDGASATRESSMKPTISIYDAFQKLLWFIVAGVILILLLFVLLVMNAGSSSSGSTAEGIYSFDDSVVSSELKRLKGEPKYNYESHYWWADADKQEVKAGANADVKDGDIANYDGPTVWKWAEYGKDTKDFDKALPYTDVTDNTESIAAFADILELIPKDSLLLDLGGGEFLSSTKWMKDKRDDVTMLVADPFRRTEEENKKVQKEVEEKGGAVVVTSMSVLSCLADQKDQASHVWLAFSTLKPGGIAMFKVYAGLWPVRGTRKKEVNAKTITHHNGKDDVARMAQNNAFADAYKELIAKVFGESNVFSDDNMNLLVARKPID